MTIMCNCAHASLKALQTLGNIQCGLSMVNWHLIFNAVCLPTLSYGCQLWMGCCKTVGLIKKIQVVFSKGICLMSGAFRMVPQEPLHEIICWLGTIWRS